MYMNIVRITLRASPRHKDNTPQTHRPLPFPLRVYTILCIQKTRGDSLRLLCTLYVL